MKTRPLLTSIFASISALVIGWQIGATNLATVAPLSLPQAGAAANGAAAPQPPAATPAVPVPATTPSAPAPAAPAATGASAAGPSAAGPSAAASTAPAPPPPPPSKDGTYLGSVVNTPFGTVQVQATIAGGAISEVTALKLTDADRQSRQISNQAAPMLRSEVLQSQSARVSSIGGATYTSTGYLTSLQAALDQVGM